MAGKCLSEKQIQGGQEEPPPNKLAPLGAGCQLKKPELATTVKVLTYFDCDLPLPIDGHRI